MDSQIVFVLWHTRPVSDHAEDVKMIGIYSSEEKANAALGRVKDQPDFRDYPAGFEIAETKLDRDDWTEGFISV